MVSNRRYKETKGLEFGGHHGPSWPNYLSLSLSDISHRKAGLWAIDTVNPNAWGLEPTI